jgi:hypothetical protein
VGQRKKKDPKLDPAEQLSATFDFMVALAPEVAKYNLRLLDKHGAGPFSIQSDEALAEARRQVAIANAKITMEFALHLTAQFVTLDAALQTTPAQDTPAPKQESAPAGEPSAPDAPARV